MPTQPPGKSANPNAAVASKVLLTNVTDFACILGDDLRGQLNVPQQKRFAAAADCLATLTALIFWAATIAMLPILSHAGGLCGPGGAVLPGPRGTCQE